MLVSHKQENIQRTSKLLIEMGLLTKIILMLLLLNMINAKPVFDLIPKRSRTFNGMTLAELRREIMKVRNFESHSIAVGENEEAEIMYLIRI